MSLTWCSILVIPATYETEAGEPQVHASLGKDSIRPCIKTGTKKKEKISGL
jgi:hypothetical protein